MLIFGIRYLTGSVVASDVADRNLAEWPPHPARVFMALAAAHFQTGDEPAERAALEWLEEHCEKHPPHICASTHTERPTVTHYVPVNPTLEDEKKNLKKLGPIQSLDGIKRTRQPRTFARAWLDNDTAYLVWPEAQPDGHFAALANLCEKVTRIGHSISLVQVWAATDAPPEPPNWIPDDRRATEQLRLGVPGAGSLKHLERQFNRKSVEEFLDLVAQSDDSSDKNKQKAAKQALKEKFRNQPPVRLRPELSLSRGYAPREESPVSAASGTVFDHRMLIFPLRRAEADCPYRHLDLAATLQLTGRFREAVLQHLGPNAPEILTGHRGGGRAEIPHVAFLPLPFVGHERAHGGIMGVALALPRELSLPDRQALLKSLAKIREEGGIKLGALGRWELASNDAGTPPLTLRDRVWTAYPSGAYQWATVTPYVHDRHPNAKDKAAYQQELAEAIKVSWQRIARTGVANISVQVVITPVSAHPGAPPSHEFPRLARKDGSQCRHTHAILIFDKPVFGPVLLGAGRYRGYGLCRPLEGGA